MPAFVNSYAAFPSLHFGWNVLVSIALLKKGTSRWMRLLGAISPAAAFLAVVLTGNHYVIDAAAGGVLAVCSLLLAPYVQAVAAKAADLRRCRSGAVRGPIRTGRP